MDTVRSDYSNTLCDETIVSYYIHSYFIQPYCVIVLTVSQLRNRYTTKNG